MSEGERSPMGSQAVNQDVLRKSLLGKEEDAPDTRGSDEGGSISIAQILSLKERFDRADTDGGGSLDLQEFMSAFGSILNKDGSKTGLHDRYCFYEQIKRLFMQIDANSDGGIDWNEFSTYMLMESKSSDSVTSLKVGSFYLSDPVGQRQPAENYHRESVDCAQVDSPSGAFYITSAKDGSIRLWGQVSLQLMKTIHLGQTWVLAMTMLPVLGRLVVSTDDRKIKFYDIHTWEVVMDVELQNPALSLCSWTHVDTEMFGANNNCLTLICTYGNDVGEITIVDMGKGLKSAKLLESQLVARKQLKRSKAWVESRTRVVHDGWVNQVRKIDDLGGIVCCGSDNKIIIFEVPFRTDPNHKERIVPRRVLQHSRGHHKGVTSFEWVPTLKLIVSCGLERELIVWNPYTCKPVMTLNGHTSGIKMIHLNDDFEQLVSLSLDRVIKVWDLRNNECVQTITEFKRPNMRPTSFLVDKARHRMVSFGQRQQVFKINPQILYGQPEDTHRAPVVAVLYNRIFGNVVTVAEDSECSVWRPVTGEQIFTFFDTERNDDTHITSANFDEVGRRLLTCDHHGVVRVWNFNNGACIKTLVKPRDPHSRQEITGVCCYVFEDKRFMAATSWDRKVTVWLDYSEDSGTVTPYMQMQGQNTDILSVAFSYPKSLAAAGADGSIFIFDVESGYKKMSLMAERTQTGRTPRDAKAALGNSQYIESIIFLEHHNRTLVSAGADGCLRFWEGQWMESVPAKCSTSVNPCNLACRVPGNHGHGLAIVDVKSDDENNFLVTADEVGFVKTWDISNYNWTSPSPDQVQPISFWKAHEVGISTIDMMVPSDIENHLEEELQPLIFTSASDKCAKMWTVDGAQVGKFGQPLQKGRKEPWNLHDKSTWLSPDSLDVLGEHHSGLDSPLSRQSIQSDSSDDDEEHFNAVLNDLDERLRNKAPSQPQLRSSCFEGQNGLPVARLDEVETMNKAESKGKKGKEYVIDEITGERIYKTGNKKSAVGEEKRRPLTQYLKHFTKKLDPENVVEKTPRHQEGRVHHDPKEAEIKITHATGSTLMRIFDVKCEGQGWKEPDAAQKDLLCAKIRQALRLKRDPDLGVYSVDVKRDPTDVEKLAKYLCTLGTNWDEMISLVDVEYLS